MKPILNSLKSRLAWYEKALEMACGAKRMTNGFNWPDAPGIVPSAFTTDQTMKDQYIMYLSGCIHELHNTIDMLQKEMQKAPIKQVNSNYGYQPKNDIVNPATPTSGSNIIKR